jgi:hypothetical protein
MLVPFPRERRESAAEGSCDRCWLGWPAPKGASKGGQSARRGSSGQSQCGNGAAHMAALQPSGGRGPTNPKHPHKNAASDVASPC